MSQPLKRNSPPKNFPQFCLDSILPPTFKTRANPAVCSIARAPRCNANNIVLAPKDCIIPLTEQNKYGGNLASDILWRMMLRVTQ